MKKSGILKFIVGVTLAASGAFAVGAALNSKKVEAVSAGTSRTVYYAVDSSIVGSYTVKLNANVGDNNTWVTSTMTKTNKTFHGMDVYQTSFDERYGGVDAMQFQLYNGGSWVSQQQPISSWTTYETYSGRMYVHGVGFKDYATDTATVTIFVDGFDWSNMYFHVYDDICDDPDQKAGDRTGK